MDQAKDFLAGNAIATDRDYSKGFHVDFSKPCRVHFMGIGGISMSSLAQF